MFSDLNKKKLHFAKYFFWKNCHIGKTFLYILDQQISSSLYFYQQSHFKKRYLLSKFNKVFPYLYGICVCICIVRGNQEAHITLFEGLVLSDLI